MRKHAVRIIGACIAVAILAVLVARIGVRAILDQLAAVGPGFFWIVLMHVVAIAVVAIPWTLLLPAAARPSLPYAVASRFASTGANAVLPLFGFAGDLVRLWWLRRADHAAGVAGLVVDRLVYGAGNALLLGAAIVAVVNTAALPASYLTAAIVGACALLVMFAVGILIAPRLKLGGRIHRLILRLRRKVEDSELGDAIDHHIETILRERRAAMALGCLLHMVGKVIIGLEVYVAFALLDVWLTWDLVILFTVLPVILSITGVLVPSQLGVQEGAFAIVAASYGIDPAIAVAVVLVMRVRQLVCAALVVVMLILHKPPARRADA